MDKRLHSRLANPQNYIMPTYRINNDWQQEEARIISEQAQKDALQEQAIQEAARAIAKLERQEAERNPWIAASKMTAIQGVNRADNLQTRSNAEENNIESWANALPTRMNTTQPSDAYIDDSTHNSWVTPLGMRKSANNTTNANNLIGIWRNGYRVPAIDIGNSNQFARLSGGYGEAGSAADVLTGEGSYMMNLAQNRGNHQYDSDATTAPLVGIDNIEGYGALSQRIVESNREAVEKIVGEAEKSAKRILGDIFFSKLIEKFPIPVHVKLPVYMLIFLYCTYKCAETAYKKEVIPYMEKHNCSLEEAAENTAIHKAFFTEFAKLLVSTYVGIVVNTFDISDKTKYLIGGLVGEVVEKIFQ